MAALAYLRDPPNLPPDLLLLDINMPGMDGFDVLRALKSDPDLATLPVVRLSTSSAGADIQRSYELHASAYMCKSDGCAAFLDLVDGFVQHWQNVPSPRRSTRGATLRRSYRLCATSANTEPNEAYTCRCECIPGQHVQCGERDASCFKSARDNADRRVR